MIIKAVSLKNIRSYKEETITFNEGSTLLSGDIGSGKSTILQGIEFALFGPRQDSMTGESLLRKGTEQGSVTLTFIVDKKHIEIERKLKRQQNQVRQSSASISINNTKIECSSTELKAKILELLGYPLDLLTKTKSLVFRYTVYTPQELMKQILFENESVRLDTIRRVFGIDKYKRISDNANIYAKELRTKQRECIAKTDGADEKKQEISSIEEKITATKNKIIIEENTLSEILKQKKEIQTKLSEIEKKNEELNLLKKEESIVLTKINAAKETISFLSKDISSVEEQEEKIKKKLDELNASQPKNLPEKNAIEQKIKQKKDMLKAITEKNISLKENIKNTEQHVFELKKELIKDTAEKITQLKNTQTELKKEVSAIPPAEQAIEELAKKILDSEREIAQKNALITASKNTIQKISQIDLCPTCKQSVSEEHKNRIYREENEKINLADKFLITEKDKITEFQLKSNAYKKRITHLLQKEKLLVETSTKISELNKKISQDSEKKEKLKVLTEKLNTINAALEENNDKKIDELKKRIEELMNVLGEIEKDRWRKNEITHLTQMVEEKKKNKSYARERKIKTEKEIEMLDLKIKKLHSKKAVFTKILDKLEIYKKEFEIIIEKEKQSLILLAEQKEKIRSAEEIIKNLKKDLDEKILAKKNAEKYSAINSWIEKDFAELMTRLEKQKLVLIHTRFSELFRSWFSMLIDSENISARLNENFTPFIIQNGYETDIAHLSGGEKTSVALSYRLALNRVITDTVSEIKTKDLLVLDEPTDGFSFEQLDRVRDVINQMHNKQTIIVSHETKIEGFVDNVIRIEKSEHVSKAQY